MQETNTRSQSEDISPRRISRESLILGFSMFVMGGCGLAYEYTFSKIASDLLGNSVRQWAIVIGVMLFFMGIGADVQKYLKDRGLLDKLIISEILLGLLGGFGPIALIYAYGHITSHYVLVQYFFISAIGLLIGFEIPLIARINQAYSKNLQINLGRILKMDYIGSLCGALLWIFVLPRFFTMVEMAFVLALLTLLVALMATVYFREVLEWYKRLFSVIAVSLLLLVTAFHFARSWTTHAEQYLFAEQIIYSTTSPYQHILLTRSYSGEISCYINGRLQFNSTDEYIYHDHLVHPAMMLAPRRDRVLVLGGGDGMAVREILKYQDVREVTLVDLDPAMTDLTANNIFFTQLNNYSLSDARVVTMRNKALVDIGDERIRIASQNTGDATGEVAKVKILNTDAATYIEQIPGRYDVIILDFPDPNSLELAKLYGQRFYSLLKNKLAADGIMVQQSTSPYHAREAYLCIGRTMESVGFNVVPYHDNVPSFGEWGWWLGGNSRIYTSDKLREKMRAIDTIDVSTRYLTPELIKASLEFGKGQLDTENTDISTTTASRVYDYYLQAWD